MITLGFLLLSCAPMWTIQLDLDDEFDSNQLKGWILEPNLSSAKNTIINEKYSYILNEYMMSLKFRIPNKKKITTFYDIDIDSIRIFIQNYRDTVFIKQDNYFYTSANRKWMSKSINFLPKDVREPSPNKAYKLLIPESEYIKRCQAGRLTVQNYSSVRFSFWVKTPVVLTINLKDRSRFLLVVSGAFRPSQMTPVT